MDSMPDKSSKQPEHAAAVVGADRETAAGPPEQAPGLVPRQQLTSDPSCAGQTGEDAVHAQALAAFEGLVLDATQSSLLELPPGAPYLHMSPAVLLRGSLRTTGMAVETGAHAGKGECR